MQITIEYLRQLEELRMERSNKELKEIIEGTYKLKKGEVYEYSDKLMRSKRSKDKEKLRAYGDSRMSNGIITGYSITIEIV